MQSGFGDEKILAKANGERYRTPGLSASPRLSEPGECLFVTAEELNGALVGFSITEMVIWRALLAEMTGRDRESFPKGRAG